MVVSIDRWSFYTGFMHCALHHKLDKKCNHCRNDLEQRKSLQTMLTSIHVKIGDSFVISITGIRYIIKGLQPKNYQQEVYQSPLWHNLILILNRKPHIKIRDNQ